MITTIQERIEVTPASVTRPAPHRFMGNGFTWALAGNVTYSLCQWAFLIVLAKLGSAEDVGNYALALAIAAPLLTFANFQGRSLVASDIHGAYSFGEYLGFRIVSLSVAVAGVLIIAGRAQNSPREVAVIFLLGVSAAFDWASETFFGQMQKYDRLDRVGQSLMLKGPLCLLLLSVAMYATRDLMWAALALVVGRGAILWLFDAGITTRIAGSVRISWKPETIAILLRAAFPLGVISAMAAFNVNIPRYFIEADLRTRDLGIFSAIASLVGAGNLVMSALANSSFVAIARASAAGNQKEYRALSLRLFATAGILGLLGVAVSVTAGRMILMKLFRPEYGASAGVFTRLMAAGSLSYITSGQGYALTAAKVLLPQIPILLCGAGTTAFFCWWLIPLHGIQGAADAWLFSSFVTLVLSSIILARVRHVDKPPVSEMDATRAAIADVV